MYISWPTLTPKKNNLVTLWDSLHCIITDENPCLKSTKSYKEKICIKIQSIFVTFYSFYLHDISDHWFAEFLIILLTCRHMLRYSCKTFWQDLDKDLSVGIAILLPRTVHQKPFSPDRNAFVIVQNEEISLLSQMPLVKWIWVTEIAGDKVSDHKYPGWHTWQIWLTSEA